MRNVLVREIREQEKAAFGDDVKNLARRLYRKDLVTGKRPSYREIAISLAEAGHTGASGKGYGPESIKRMLAVN